VDNKEYNRLSELKLKRTLSEEERKKLSALDLDRKIVQDNACNKKDIEKLIAIEDKINEIFLNN
jgi:hypothetical protein